MDYSLLCDTRINDPKIMQISIGVQEVVRYSPLDRFYFTNETLSFCLYGKGNEILVDDFDELVRFGHVKKIRPNLFYCSSDIYKNPGFHYTIITQDEFHSLQKPGLLYHFIKIVESLNWDSHIGFMSIDYFARAEGVNEKTIRRMNAKLEEMHLISIVPRAGVHTTNLYCRPAYESVARAQAAAEGGRATAPNVHRHMAAKYRHFREHPETYSDFNRNSLKREFEQYNARYPDHARDLSIFDVQLDKIKESSYNECNIQGVYLLGID